MSFLRSRMPKGWLIVLFLTIAASVATVTEPVTGISFPTTLLTPGASSDLTLAGTGKFAISNSKYWANGVQVNCKPRM